VSILTVLRFICPSLPGWGYSDPHDGRTWKDFADDIEELVNELHVEKFNVIGVTSTCCQH
jgi:pimeloyl-ACP methyl ester carboxylesterase